MADGGKRGSGEEKADKQRKQKIGRRPKKETGKRVIDAGYQISDIAINYKLLSSENKGQT